MIQRCLFVPSPELVVVFMGEREQVDTTEPKPLHYRGQMPCVFVCLWGTNRWLERETERERETAKCIMTTLRTVLFSKQKNARPEQVTLLRS
jgi:hypothetical protein